MSEDTGIESAESPESSASSESHPAVETQDAGGTQDASTTKQDVPFHEHPRFKELIEQKNQSTQRAEKLEKSYQQLQSQIAQLEKQYKQPQAPKPSYDPLFKQIEEANPEFAGFSKELYQKVQAVESLQERIAQQEQFIQNYQQQQAISQFDKMCDESKVPARFKEFYKEAVANAANASGAPLSALPEIFKSVHDRFSKSIDEYSREITQNYVTQKTQDKKPATQTGGRPAAPKATQATTSKDDVKKQLAAAIRARVNPA